MIGVVGQAIRAKLTANSAVTALVGQRIYNTLAPADATYPYVEIIFSAGGHTNVSGRDPVDVSMTVKAVGNNPATAASVDSAVLAALHEANLGSVGGWSWYRCQAVTIVGYQEAVEREIVYHIGAVYRIRGAK